MRSKQGPSISDRRIHPEGSKSLPKQTASYSYGPGLVSFPMGTDAPSPEGTPYDVSVMLPPMTVPGPAPAEHDPVPRPLVD